MPATWRPHCPVHPSGLINSLKKKSICIESTPLFTQDVDAEEEEGLPALRHI